MTPQLKKESRPMPDIHRHEATAVDTSGTSMPARGGRSLVRSLWVTLDTLTRGALRDRISLFWSVAFPLVLLGVLDAFFADPLYRARLLIGLLAISTMFFALSGTAFEVVAQRARGIYKLLRVTPMRTSLFVADLALARTLVALLSAALVAAVGFAIDRPAVDAVRLALLLPVLLLGAVCFTFLGVFVGNLARQEAQASMLGNLVTLPMVFTSDAFYSLAHAPASVRAIGAALPFSHLLDDLAAALRGDATGLVVPCLLLAGYCLLALALATITFRWDPHAAS
jgi:ABC-2 type transport system permease protein